MTTNERALVIGKIVVDGIVARWGLSGVGERDGVPVIDSRDLFNFEEDGQFWIDNTSDALKRLGKIPALVRVVHFDTGKFIEAWHFSGPGKAKKRRGDPLAK